jgi:hypothetical protein
MKQEIPYKAAAVAAITIAAGQEPEKILIQNVAQHLRISNPTQRKAFESFLRGFEQPRLMRLVAGLQNEAGEIPALAAPLGEIRFLLKSPLPGETQARLAYEGFLCGFLAYLQRTCCVCTLQESSAHVTVFVPKGQELDLEGTWNKYVQDAFSRKGLTESFVLLLNSVQLAGRGFGVIDVPMISKEQKQVFAGFYLAAVREVERRLRWRKTQIRELEKESGETPLATKERSQTVKKLKNLQTKMQEETEKYTNAFEKALLRFLTKEEKALQKDTQKKGSRSKSTKRIIELAGDFEGESSFSKFHQDRLKTMRQLLNNTQGDPFKFVEEDNKDRPDVFAPALQVASRFTEQAGRQLATSVGAKFAGFILEVYRLLDGNVPLTQIPPLFSCEPIPSIERSAGDASGEWCYSCGIPMGKKEPAYEVRRFLFSSPDQRPQSSFSSNRPKACPICTAVALTCPLKLSDQNVIIRLDSRGERVGTLDYVRDYCRMLTIGTLNTAAGRYLSLVCTERTAKGGLASKRMGKTVYAIAKLGLELPSDIFRDFKLTLITEGSEVVLDAAVLFATAGFLQGYGQRIIIGGNLNTTLSQAVRYIQAGAFYAAEYTFVADGASFRDDFGLERHRTALWEFLNKQVEEAGMNKNAEQRARFYGDVAALTGLLYAFCAALKTKHRNSDDNVGRILGKVIEYVDDSPAFFTYTAITNELSSETARLYKDPSHHFLYDRTKALLLELGLNDREKMEENFSYLQLYFDDIANAYSTFSQRSDYKGERLFAKFEASV